MKKEPLIILIPFAGGSVYSYSELVGGLKEKKVLTLELPGRGKRFGESLLTDLNDAVDDLYSRITAILPQYKEYYLYGHSMGSLLAYLLVRRIINSGYNPPKHLFVSGRGGPSHQNEKKDWHLLPSSEFWEMIGELGGCPKEVLESEDLMGVFEPVLRADFEVLSNFKYVSDSALPVAITGFFGTEEKVTFDEMKLWQIESTHQIEIIECSGDHFFIFKHCKLICNKIKAVIDA